MSLIALCIASSALCAEEVPRDPLLGERACFDTKANEAEVIAAVKA